MRYVYVFVLLFFPCCHIFLEINKHINHQVGVILFTYKKHCGTTWNLSVSNKLIHNNIDTFRNMRNRKVIEHLFTQHTKKKRNGNRSGRKCNRYFRTESVNKSRSQFKSAFWPHGFDKKDLTSHDKFQFIVID